MYFSISHAFALDGQSVCKSNFAFQISSTGVALGAAFVAYGISLGEAGEIWKAAGIGSAALTLFATRAVPEIVTAFGIFLSALALGIIPK